MLFKAHHTSATTPIPPAPIVVANFGFFTLYLDFSNWDYPKYQQWEIQYRTSTDGSAWGSWIFGQSVDVSDQAINYYEVDPSKYYQFRYRLRARSDISLYSPATGAISSGGTKPLVASSTIEIENAGGTVMPSEPFLQFDDTFTVTDDPTNQRTIVHALGTIDPVQSALGVLRVVGPTNVSFAANGITSIVINVPTWEEVSYNRVVVGLIITHPNISKIGASVEVPSVAEGGLFGIGSFDAVANIGDPTNPNDPDSFVYFSDLGNPDIPLTRSSAIDPNSWSPAGWNGNPLIPNADSYRNATFTPDLVYSPYGSTGTDQVADELAILTGAYGNLTLTIGEHNGSVGTLNAVVVYFISSEFDAIRGWLQPKSSIQTAANVLSLGVKNDGLFKGDGAMTAGQSILNSPSSSFTVEDIGKLIAVSRAQAAQPVDHNTLLTTISAVNSATQIQLATPADTTVTNTDFVYGTDNTAAFSQFNLTSSPKSYFFPGGVYMARAASWGKISVQGAGDRTILLMAGQSGAESGTPGVGSFIRIGSSIIRDFSIGMVWNFNNYIYSLINAPSTGFGGLTVTGGVDAKRINQQTYPFVNNATLNPPWTALQAPGGFPMNYVTHCGLQGQGDGVSITGGMLTIADCNIGNYDALSLGLQGMTINYSNGTAAGSFDIHNVVCTGSKLKINGTGMFSPFGLRVTECQFDSIDVAANVGNFKIINCETVNTTATGITVTAGTSDFYMISLNNTNGTGVHDNGTGTHKVVTNNI